MKRAKALFVKAEAAAKAKDYLPSADLYLEAFELFPSADFIFNAASMYQLAGEDDKASKYFKEYLSLAPNGRGAKEAKSALTEYKFQREVELERAREEKRIAEGAKTKAETDAANARAKENDKALGSTESDEGTTRGNTMRLPAIIGMSAGGILVGVGIYFGLRSGKISDEVSDSPIYDPELEKKGEDAARNAYIFGGVGAAVIVGGAVVYVLGKRDRDKEGAVSIIPALTPDFAGAFARGEF